MFKNGTAVIIIFGSYSDCMQYSKNQISRAGKTVIKEDADPNQVTLSVILINDWRTLHLYPVKSLQAGLQDRIDVLGLSSVLISQRLKRFDSISSKLKRERTMKLGEMQDIGGIRSVLEDTEAVYLLYNDFINIPLEHFLVDTNDYIKEPKSSGYRSIHLIYKFQSPEEPKYNNLQIELQIRSKLQHLWATSIETVGTFLKQSLKSSQGSEKWLEFFKYISSIFAFREGHPTLKQHQHLLLPDLVEEAYKLSKELNVVKLLSAFKVSTNAINTGKYNGEYYLIEINLKDRLVNILSYNTQNLNQAFKKYAQLEAKALRKPTEVVLVSAESVNDLEKAYPSFFLDTEDFIDKINLLDRYFETKIAPNKLLALKKPIPHSI